jgi:uncharacterized protein YbgA (DUF1722 family)/uncharacterized protein YbbK (DUF523 family)
MAKIDGEKLRLGVSACLLGEPVRYDGGHKHDAFLTETLGAFVEWVPVCPEVEIGLGVPRPTLRLVGDAASPRLLVERTGEDLSDRMRRFAEARVAELARLQLDGYVLKRASPSCGLLRVPVHDGPSRRPGRGLYAAVLTDRLPLLPVEEEGRLADPALRESFMERVLAAARWRRFVASRPRAGDLVAFHARHKLTVLAHSPARYARLGRLVAGREGRLTRGAGLRPRVLESYAEGLMRALAVPATRARHTNVLQHVAGFFKRDLSGGDRAELADVIDDYRRGLLPRAAPLTLLRHHIRRLGHTYLADHTYLEPDPS